MFPQRHPETGVAGRRAKESLFTLLISTILLALALNGLFQHLWDMRTSDLGWWVGLGLFIAFITLLGFLSIRWDDRRIGQAETTIELLLPYVLSGREKADLAQRRSYPATTEARKAWKAAFSQGLALTGREGAFTNRILPEHMALVRYVLTVYLARFGQLSRPEQAVHGWLRVELLLKELEWESLPMSVRDVPFAKAAHEARPESLWLPQGTTVETFDKGSLLLRLIWRPTHRRCPKRWLCWLLGAGRWPPGGEVRVRWLGPLSEVSRHDKRYEHLTARARRPSPEGKAQVVVTRLVVEVESRWNILEEVERFRDWGVNLGLYWQRQMDYWTWRAYRLERLVDDLDWKIGWIEKAETSSIASRLAAIEKRLIEREAPQIPASISPTDGI
jgi:hypothetical protein